MLKQIKQLIDDKKGNATLIMSGIMITILGFATLTVGNYIIYGIISALPAITGTMATDYATTTATILNYAETVLPLFGMALMIFGFAIILYVIRGSLGVGQSRTE